ncbi:MAG: carboxypeptidase-like regulatory domain-containing protein, partial [Chitinophagaceae bacterium]
MRKIVSVLLFALISVISIAQTRSVPGRVTDNNGEPVPGATINVKGTRNSVSADANGSFTINAQSGDVLVVSAVGVSTREIRVGSESSLDISLVRQNENLSEVVVTALGIRREKKALGYAV